MEEVRKVSSHNTYISVSLPACLLSVCRYWQWKKRNMERAARFRQVTLMIHAFQGFKEGTITEVYTYKVSIF